MNKANDPEHDHDPLPPASKRARGEQIRAAKQRSFAEMTRLPCSSEK
jgi:hypothetical protein